MARKRRDDEELEHEEPEEVVELDDDIEDAEPKVEEDAAADDLLDLDEPAEEEAPLDLDEPAEEPALDLDEPAEEGDPLDLDEPPEDEAAGALPPEEPEEKEEVEAQPPLRPRTPIFTIVLLILNLLVVPVFLILAFMDYAARQQWSYATLVNRVYPLGLPLEEDEKAASAATLTGPRLRIDPDKLKDAYAKRPKPPGTPNVPEPFQAVDTLEESIHTALRPSQIGDAVKADLFNGLGTGVSTLEEEVIRLKHVVPDKIAKAAENFAEGLKGEDKKKEAAENLLLPLAWSTKNVEELKSKIDAASGAKLDELVKDAAERRMLVDLLAPMNVYRPALPENFEVEKVVELKDGEFVYPLAKLNELLRNRFDEAIAPQHLAMFQAGEPKRDDIEKRHAIGFLLFSVARLKAPDSTPLVVSGLERAQVVSGLYEFAQAAANYVRTLHVLEGRMLEAIAGDRDGYLVVDKADPSKVLGRTNAFMDEHATDIQRLKRVTAEIDFTNRRLKDLEIQRKRYQDQYDERTKLLAEVTNRLVESRVETKKILDDIHQLEQDIYDAQKKLSDAAERNSRLELQIVRSEQLLLKGGKK